MSEIYGQATNDVIVAFANGVPSKEVLSGIYEQVLLLTPWLLDLAQSYPPPAMLEEYGPDAAMFDPVVRYIALLRAVNRMSQAHADDIARALANGDVWQAETVLLDSCPFPYPSSRGIYTNWLELLNGLAGGDEWDAPLFRMRRDAIAHRLESGRGKGIFEIVDSRVPVQMLIEGFRIQGIVVGDQLLEEVRGPLLNAMVQRTLDLELYDLLLAGGTFACPYARIERCEARTPECSTGIDRFDRLPPAEGCAVRKDLESLGYYI
jgi:hypothetical protein